MSALRSVKPETLKAWLDQGRALPVDVREANEFARERIDGARPVPLTRFDPDEVPPATGPTPVLYCRTGIRSEEAARRLLTSGAPEAWHLEGGLRAWRAAGFAVQGEPTSPIGIMRQVQIVVGGLVLASVGLGLLISPWFLAVSALAGAGMLVAGLTDTCAMAGLLSRMPWNRRRPD